MIIPQTNRRRGFTIVELLTVIFVVTVLLALVAPSIHQAQRDARRDKCKNNLKQIGLAMHNYHDVYGSFPPGWTNHHRLPGKGGRYGWSLVLTPFLEEFTLYEQVDFLNQDPWEALEVTQAALPIFRCPADSTRPLNPMRGNFGTSNYSGNFGTIAPPRWLEPGLSANWIGQPPTPDRTNGILWWNSNCGMRHITDGTSNTIMIGERSVQGAAGIWMGVRGNNFESDLVTDCSPGNEINSGANSFSSRHRGGSLFLICDGSTRFLSADIESGVGADGLPEVYQRLADRGDNLIVDLP